MSGTTDHDALPARLDRPTRRALEEIGITRLSQLTGVTAATVLGLHGPGPKAVERMRAALADRGLSFAEDVPAPEDTPDRDSGDLPPIGRPARDALAQAGHTRLDQLTTVSATDLLALHGVGPKAIRILRDALAARGQSFTDEEMVEVNEARLSSSDDVSVESCPLAGQSAASGSTRISVET